MTNTKTIKQNMRRGLGRSILELKNADNVEDYREAVMWGCLHNLSYDPQCEGTHSLQLYDMINLFPNPRPFLEAIEKHMDVCYKNSSGEFLKCSELLCFFAADGNTYALDAIKRINKKLFDILLKKRVRHNNNELESFEDISIALLTNIPENTVLNVYLDIAANMGTIAKNSLMYKDETFDWFQDTAEEIIGKEKLAKVFKKEKEKNPALAYYDKVMSDVYKQRSDFECAKTTKTAEEIYNMLKSGESKFLARGAAITLAHEKKSSELQKLAKFYVNETNKTVKARLLWLFGFKNLYTYLNFDEIKKDALSENKELQKTAFEIMAKIRDSEVRKIALDFAEKGGDLAIWLPLLARNYEPCDKELFIKSVKKLKITFTANDWHGVFFGIRNMFRFDDIAEPPEELLFYIYEKSYCSSCRLFVLQEMDKRGIITEEILNECIYDSNDEIRDFAKSTFQKKS